MTNFAVVERRHLAALLRRVGPDAPTLCEGWVTRDLAVHLIERDSRPDLIARTVLPKIPVLSKRAQEADARGVVVVDSSGRPRAVVSEAAVLATPEERRPWVPVGSVAKVLVDGMVLDRSLSGEPLLEARPDLRPVRDLTEGAVDVARWGEHLVS